ncbi:MAG: hypothetical protein ACTSSJ_00175 [Candidatus Odinarchaeia archaeon]
MNSEIAAFTPVKIILKLETVEDKTKCDIEMTFIPPVNVWEFINKEDAIDIFRDEGFRNVSIGSKSIEKNGSIYTVIFASVVYPMTLGKFELIQNKLQSSIRRFLKKLPIKVNR